MGKEVGKTQLHRSLGCWRQQGAGIAMVDVRPSERQGIRKHSRSSRLSDLGKEWAAEIAQPVWQGATLLFQWTEASEAWSKGTLKL